MITAPPKQNAVDREMPECKFPVEDYPERLYCARSGHITPDKAYAMKWGGACREYIRANLCTPAILAAIDATLARYDAHFPLAAYPERDGYHLDQYSGSLTVGMLRTLRGMWT